MAKTNKDVVRIKEIFMEEYCTTILPLNPVFTTSLGKEIHHVVFNWGYPNLEYTDKNMNIWVGVKKEEKEEINKRFLEIYDHDTSYD